MGRWQTGQRSQTGSLGAVGGASIRLRRKRQSNLNRCHGPSAGPAQAQAQPRCTPLRPRADIREFSATAMRGQRRDEEYCTQSKRFAVPGLLVAQASRQPPTVPASSSWQAPAPGTPAGFATPHGLGGQHRSASRRLRDKQPRSQYEPRGSSVHHVGRRAARAVIHSSDQSTTDNTTGSSLPTPSLRRTSD